MDILRTILWRAHAHNMSLLDVTEAAAFAETLDDWDNALDELALATTQPDVLAELIGR